MFLLPLLFSCAQAKQTERPVQVQNGKVSRAVTREPAPTVVERSQLYAVDEAIRDATSSPLQYLGTGTWPGIERSRACVFRNQRVLIVNAYCTLTDMHAVRVDVFSPERGRVRVYAEANGPISIRDRRSYFSFSAESEPPPARAVGIPPLSLLMSFSELRSYDALRYEAYLPGCYGGKQRGRDQGGCLGTLAGHASQWAARNHTFLEQANSDWYRLVRELRAQAARYGFDPQ